MKKMKKMKINGASSMNRGIIFNSKRHWRYISVATVDDDGNIETRWLTRREYRKSKSKQEKIAGIIGFIKYLLCVLPIIVCLVLIFEKLAKINYIIALNTFYVGQALVILGQFLVSTWKTRKTNPSSFRFHSAEHMVINAYKDLNRVPSLEEIKKYSRFINTCGTNLTTQFFLLYMILPTCNLAHSIKLKIFLMIVTLIIVLLFTHLGKLNFLQKLSTIPATDVELKVAIEGLNTWYVNEQKEKQPILKRLLNFLLSFAEKLFHDD